MKSTVIVALIALCFPAAFLMGATEVEACDPAPEEVQWSYPGEGDVIGPDQEIMVMTVGRRTSNRTIRLLDEGGDEVGFSFEFMGMPQFLTNRIVISPEEPLGEGAYTLEIEYEQDSLDRDNDYAVGFSVNEDLSSAVPGPVTFEWYQETYEEGVSEPCSSGDEKEYHLIALTPLEDEVAYYQILFQREGDAAQGVQLVAPSMVDGSFRAYVEPANCLTVFAVALDGTTGDEVQICRPDKCNHFEAPVPALFNSTDWEQIEGCGPDADGDGDNGACSQSGSPLPSPALVVVLMAMGLLWSRQKK